MRPAPQPVFVSVAPVDAGQITILEDEVSGVDVADDYQSPGFGAADRRLVLTLDVFLGRIRVTR